MPPVRFQTHGRHSNLYPVDLPDVLDEGIKDQLLTKFSIDLLKDLLSLLDQEDTKAANAKAANAKHVHSRSDVSQPESVALSLSSSLGGSVDTDPPWANHQQIDHYRRGQGSRELSCDRVESWRNSSCDLEQPEMSK